MKSSHIPTDRADVLDICNEITGALVHRYMEELGVYSYREHYGDPPDAIRIDDDAAYQNASADVWANLVGDTFEVFWQAPDDDPDAEPDGREIRAELETIADHDAAKREVSGRVLAAVAGKARPIDGEERRLLLSDYEADDLADAVLLATDKYGAKLYRVTDEDFAVEGSTGTVYPHLSEWEALREWIV